MSETLHKMQVIIEANNSGLTKAARESIKTTKRMTEGINSEIKRIVNPMQGLKMDGNIQNLRRQMRNYMKEVQVAAGLKVYTDDYKRLGQDISITQKELNKLREKMDGMDQSKRYVPTQEFKDLEKNIKSTQKQLEKLNTQKTKMESSGKATVPTEEYAEVSKHLSDAQSRLDGLIAKQNEWKSIGVGSDGVAMKNLTASIKETEKEISYLKGEMKDLEETGKAFTQIDAYRDLTGEIARTEKKLKEYKDLYSQMLLDGTNLKESEAFQRVGLAIADAENKLRSYYATKKNMEDSGQDVRATGGFVNNSYGAAMEAVIKSGMSSATAKIREMNTELMNAIREMPVLGRVASEAAYIGSKAFGGLRSIFNKVSSGIKSVSGAFASLIQRFRSGIPGINRTRSSVNGLNGSFSGGLKSIIKYTLGIRSLFVLFNRLRGAIKDGFTNLAQYSSTTNASLSMLTSGLTQVKNSLATAFAPILNTVAPILSTLIDYLVAATTAIAHFFAALTGQKTFTVAKKVSQDFASTAGSANDANSAAQELKRTLMGFDEINKLDDNSSGSGGSGGGSGVGDMFDTVEVDSKYQDLANQVKSYFQDIFKPMQDAWNTYGESTISAWKSALDNVLALLKDIALTFRDVWTNGTGEEVCGNILQILTQIGQAISEVASAFKSAWDDGDRGYNYIQSILNRLNSMLVVIKTIGDSLLTVWSNGSGEEIIGNILEIFTNINNTIANIRNNFAAAWKLDDTGTKIIQDLADLLNNMLGHVNNITEGLQSWAKDLDLSPLLKAFNDLTTALKPLGDKVGAGLEWLFENILQPLAKWAVEQAIPAALNAVSGALDVIDAVIDKVKPAFTWLWENFLEPIAKWTGGAITTVLNDIGDGLKGLSKLIDGFDSTEVIEVGVSLFKKGWDTVSGWLGDAKDTVLEIGAKIKTKASDLWNGLKNNWNNLTNTVVDFSAKVKNESSEWWSNVRSWWSGKVGAVESFTTSVSNSSSTWWSNVKSWWASKVGPVKDFTTAVANTSLTWWSNTKAWWASKVGSVKNFTTGVSNDAKTWWSNVKLWWSGKVGSVRNFTTNVSNQSYTWWKNVKNWWSGKVGTAQSFKVGVLNQASSWWTSVKTWWDNYVRNRSLSAKATITTTHISSGGGTFGGSGSNFASGGLYKNGRWRPVTAAASGGTFSMGQMFIAREAGPELVGTIGGNTAVMNNNQIVSSVSAGVYQAVVAALRQYWSQNNSGGTPILNIYVGGKKVTDVVIEEVNNRTKATGVCPILT